MKKEWKYSIALIVTLTAYILLELFGPKGIDWKHSYSREDKIPYGNYILYTRLNDIFPGKKINPSLRTIFETSDTLSDFTNYIFINESFKLSATDLNKLLEAVARGNTAFIATRDLNKKLTDTLGITQTDKQILFSEDSSKFVHLPDSIWLKTSHSDKAYYFKSDAILNYFEVSDTSAATIVGKNQFGDATFISVPFGSGKFLLSSTPLVYSNYYMLHENNAEYISQTLSYLPLQNVLWDEYYIKPRKNTSTPLRFILEQEGLRWALYILLASIILFMFFEAKRRQRIIPIIKAPTNESLGFIKTIGRLYLHSHNAKIASGNKIAYFTEHIRRTYLLRTAHLDNTFVELLSQKSGVDKSMVEELIAHINIIKGATTVSEAQLVRLTYLIKEFQKNSKNISNGK